MILIRITHELTRPRLLSIAKKSGLKRYSLMRKCQLVDMLKTHFAALFCTRMYFKHSKIQKVYINTTDPLTLCELKHPYFELEITPGKYHRYNMNTFYTYMIKTGNFKDPYTDMEFTPFQLKQMDKQLQKYKFMKQSLLSIKNNPQRQNYYQRQQEREDSLLGMDRQIGDLLTETCDDLFEKLQSGNNAEHNCYHGLTHMFLPNLVYLLEQLKMVDISYTRNCLIDYISWVKKQNVPLGNIITNMLKNELYCIS